MEQLVDLLQLYDMNVPMLGEVYEGIDICWKAFSMFLKRGTLDFMVP
jgi:hypothetical protein